MIVERVETWTGSPDDPVRLADVRNWLVDEARRPGEVQVIFDSWQSVGMAQELQERDLRAQALQLTAPLKSQIAHEFIRAIRERTLELPDDAGLLRELSRVRVRESAAGLLRIDHDAGEHDDRIASIGLAMIKALEDSRRPGPRLRSLL